MNKCYEPIIDVKTVCTTASEAYNGYKKSGVIGAILGGIKGYRDATKLKKYIIH